MATAVNVDDAAKLLKTATLINTTIAASNRHTLEELLLHPLSVVSVRAPLAVSRALGHQVRTAAQQQHIGRGGGVGRVELLHQKERPPKRCLC